MDTPKNIDPTLNHTHAHTLTPATRRRGDLTVLPPPLPVRVAPLVPVLAADAEVTPDLDRVLTAAARAARAGDAAARNALYFALEPKIVRFAARFRHPGWGTGGAWDEEDVLQEAFVVVAEMVAGWPGDGAFTPYFLDLFPRRLGDAVRRLDGPRAEPVGLAPIAVADVLDDDSAAAAAAQALLVELTTGLDPVDARLLLWRVRDRASFGEIAGRLRLNRRTVRRRWLALLGDLRHSLDGGQRV